MALKPDKIVPDYAAKPAPPRGVCGFGAASVILPIVMTAYMRSDTYFKHDYLDVSLGLSPRGMFWSKLTIVTVPYLIAIALALWSFRRTPPTPVLHRRPIALIGLACSMICLVYSGNIIYSLYQGYL